MTKESLVADDRTFDAVMRNLEITGEAARKVPDDLQRRFPEVPWRSIAGFRDVAIHAYPTVDEDVVWDIVANNKVPELHRQLEVLLRALPE